MKLSIIVIVHNMVREASRTLFSLSPAYQRGVFPAEYEVIAIDNGSDAPLNADDVQSLGPNFRYRFFDTTSVSPAEAVNAGAEMARGDLLALIVDGARMASPGLIGQSLAAARPFANPFVAGLAWHLGPDVQFLSMLQGYDRAEEDRLLASIAWEDNGYDLFSISTIAPSSRGGFLAGVPSECSWLCMPRAGFQALGGFDPKFRTPGGGLVNHDFRDRALTVSDCVPIVLLGEGVFHQFHGGIATNVEPKVHPMPLFQAEYSAIHGAEYRFFGSPPAFHFGTLPAQAKRFIG